MRRAGGILHTHPRPARAHALASSHLGRLDLHEKRPVYAREGVAHLWLVEPTDRILEAFALRDGQWVLIGTSKDDEPVGIPPFDAITFSLGNLWP